MNKSHRTKRQCFYAFSPTRWTIKFNLKINTVWICVHKRLLFLHQHLSAWNHKELQFAKLVTAYKGSMNYAAFAWYEIVYSFLLGYVMSMFMHVYLLLDDDKHLVKRVVFMYPKTIFPRWWLPRLNPLAQWHETHVSLSQVWGWTFAFLAFYLSAERI